MTRPTPAPIRAGDAVAATPRRCPDGLLRRCLRRAFRDMEL